MKSYECLSYSASFHHIIVCKDMQYRKLLFVDSYTGRERREGGREGVVGRECALRAATASEAPVDDTNAPGT